MPNTAGLGLVSLRPIAHKLPGSDSNEAANQRYDAENEHRPIRPSAAEIGTQSPKIEGLDQRGEKKTYSD
jgi:hypothetical protein